MLPAIPAFGASSQQPPILFLRYDAGLACDAFFIGGFVSVGQVRGLQLCQDGSGVTGIWIGAVTPSMMHMRLLMLDTSEYITLDTLDLPSTCIIIRINLIPQTLDLINWDRIIGR